MENNCVGILPPQRQSPSPQRASRILKAISRKLARRPADEICSADDDTRSSASSSCSTGSAPAAPQSPNSPDAHSDGDSDSSDRRRRGRSTTASFRKVFQNLTIATRSHSCSTTRSHSPVSGSRSSKKSQQPKRILRQPVTYTYVRGLSGLPTQRVPRARVGPDHFITAGLNR